MSVIDVGSLLTFSIPSSIKSKHLEVWNTDIPARGCVSWPHQWQHRAGAAQSEETNSCQPFWGEGWLQNEEQNIPRNAPPGPQIQQGPPNSCLIHLFWHLLGRQFNLERKRNRLIQSEHDSLNSPLNNCWKHGSEGWQMLTEASGETFNRPWLCSQWDSSNCVKGCREVPSNI